MITERSEGFDERDGDKGRGFNLQGEQMGDWLGRKHTGWQIAAVCFFGEVSKGQRN